MDFDTDVVVLGAGPVGMTLANELARHGVRPRIVDKGPGIREVSKAMILHVRTQEVLDKVGVAARLGTLAEPLRDVVVHAYGKHIGSWNLDGIDSPWPHPLILGQNRTQHVLLDRLAEQGVVVEWNTEATALEVSDSGVTVQLRHPDGPDEGEVVRSRYVVGCEGSNSLVRRTMGFTFEGERYSGEQFIQADCRIKWALPKGRSYLFLTPDGYMMVIEFPDDVVRIFISLPDDPAGAGATAAAGQLGAVESTTEEPTLAEIAYHLTRLTGHACTLSEPIWRARYRTSHRYANRFSAGPAFIAGDAAHVHVPIGGQGMNTGIQDAFNLGWKLAGAVRGTLRPEVLESYHAERHPVAEALIRGTDLAYGGVLHPSELRQHATRLLGPFIIRNTMAQDFMRSTLEELKVFYPESPLNLDAGGPAGPRPGERVLDTVLVRASDLSTVHLHELISSTQWQLLLFGGVVGAPPDPDMLPLLKEVAAFPHVEAWLVLAEASVPEAAPPERVLLDVLHAAHRRYGVVEPGFYLLRPDTYVAARGPQARRDQLLAHLRGLFQS